MEPLVLRTAILLLKRGEPLPLHITASLLAHGYDASALERRHGA